MQAKGKEALLDRDLLQVLQPNGEKLAYGLILLLAVVSRLWDLGARSMSWDECTHALFSYKLFHGEGFVHDPMMHGPFLFHANALVFTLFGDTDYTARLMPGLFGVLLVMSPLLLRRWLGQAGALFASLLLLISPSVLFYSRYLRNEVYIAVWMVLLTAVLFRFLEDPKPRWLTMGAGLLMLSLATKENAYFFGFVDLVFLVQVVVWQRLAGRPRVWLYVSGAALSAFLLATTWALASPVMLADGSAEVSGAGTLLASLIAVLGGTLPASLLSAPLIRPLGPGPSVVEVALRRLRPRHWLVAALCAGTVYVLLFTAFFTSPEGLGSGLVGSVRYWLAQQDVQRGGQPWYYYGLLLGMYEFLPLLLGVAGGIYFLVRRRPAPGRSAAASEPGPGRDIPTDASALRSLFTSFLILWLLFSLFIYAWAGERMPWMVVHQVIPLLLLAARFLGHVVERTRFFRWPSSVSGIRAALLPAALASVLLLLGLGTVRFAFLAAYINYDFATEPLVYAHGGVDVRATMDQIAEISRRTVGGKDLPVAYDADSAWPLEWYLREYPNRRYFGMTPTREVLDTPVVIASAELDGQIRPFLGNRYTRFRRREIWWPNQQYMDLSWQRIRDLLASPEKRKILWDILYYRRYPRPTNDWYHVDIFYLYVRRDVAHQVWAYAAE